VSFGGRILGVRKSSIIEWFHRAKFGVNDITGDELQTFCPKCGYVNFYFNLKKLAGFCHKARCEYHYNPPTLEDLEELAGFGPDSFGYRIGVDEQNPPRNFPTIELPGELVVQSVDGELQTKFPEVMDYLHKRHLDTHDITRFGLTYDGVRVYVPVYQGENLINYVGRDLTGKEKRKYLYSPGAKTSEWIFGWDECKDWERLTLVENTFVSISFRNRIQCSTNFGSSLSDAQVTLIHKSHIKTVAILWDENTHRAANKAVRKLENHGVRACYALIPGQPDDHDRQRIVEIALKCHDWAKEGGKKFIDPWGIAREKYRQDLKDRQAVMRRRNK
jgi:hypothetical protein